MVSCMKARIILFVKWPVVDVHEYVRHLNLNDKLLLNHNTLLVAYIDEMSTFSKLIETGCVTEAYVPVVRVI